MKRFPQLLETNVYKEDAMIRVVKHFHNISPVPVSLDYMYGVYEIFYPHFRYREHSEQAFEELLNLAVQSGVSIGQMVCVTIGIMEDFKRRRALE